MQGVQLQLLEHASLKSILQEHLWQLLSHTNLYIDKVEHVIRKRGLPFAIAALDRLRLPSSRKHSTFRGNQSSSHAQSSWPARDSLLNDNSMYEYMLIVTSRNMQLCHHSKCGYFVSGLPYQCTKLTQMQLRRCGHGMHSHKPLAP